MKRRVDFGKQKGSVVCAHCGEFGRLELFCATANGRQSATVVHARTENPNGLFNEISDEDACRWNHEAIMAGQLPTYSVSAKRQITKWLKDGAAERERREKSVRRVARRQFIDDALFYVHTAAERKRLSDLDVYGAGELLEKIAAAEAAAMAEDAERYGQHEPKVYSKRARAERQTE